MDDGRGWRADLAVLILLLVGLNVATTLVLGGWATPVAQVGAALAAVAGARWRGYSRTALGLAPGDAPSGLRLGGLVAAGVVAVVTVAAAVPGPSSFFADDRFLDLSTGEVLYEVGFRIPVVTALTEELLFRSVLLAVLLVAMSQWRAVLASSFLFGLWHVATTIGDLGGNEVTDDLGAWETALSVTGVVVVTGIAGVAFCWLRLRSASIVAPWLVHSAINASAFVAGVVLAG